MNWTLRELLLNSELSATRLLPLTWGGAFWLVQSNWASRRFGCPRVLHLLLSYNGNHDIGHDSLIIQGIHQVLNLNRSRRKLMSVCIWSDETCRWCISHQGMWKSFAVLRDCRKPDHCWKVCCSRYCSVNCNHVDQNCGRWCEYVMIFLIFLYSTDGSLHFWPTAFPTSGSTSEETKPVQDHLDYTPIRDHTDSVNCLSLAYRINGSVASFATSSDDSNIYVYSARKWGLKAPGIVVCNIWWPVVLIYTLTHRCCMDRR